MSDSKPDVYDLRKDVEKILESQKHIEAKIEKISTYQTEVQVSSKIYKWVTSAILAILVSVSGYFFAMVTDHESRLTKIEATAPNYATRDDLSRLSGTLDVLTEVVRQNTKSSEQLHDALERLE